MFLLVSLICVIVVPPFIRDEALGIGIGGLMLALTPLTGVWAVSTNRRHMVAALVLAIPTFVMLIRYALLGAGFQPGATTAGLTVLYYAVTTWMVFHNVLHSKRVTGETLVGAASVYLLLGLTYGVVYAAINSYMPDAFRADAPLRFGELLYFSFVTLTTLGYGDISPVAPQVRAIVVLETLTGVLYLAFVIARMVSMYRTDYDD